MSCIAIIEFEVLFGLTSIILRTLLIGLSDKELFGVFAGFEQDTINNTVNNPKVIFFIVLNASYVRQA